MYSCVLVEDPMMFGVKICKNTEDKKGAKTFLQQCTVYCQGKLYTGISHEGKLEQSTINC